MANTQTSVPVFTAGQVLTAAQQKPNKYRHTSFCG
jgi:hypothetical protein